MRASATAAIARSTPRPLVGGQPSDEFAVRVSGLWQHRNDWIDNLDEPGENDLEGYTTLPSRPDQVEADRGPDPPPDRPVSPPRRRCAHLPPQLHRSGQQRAGRRRWRRFRARRSSRRRHQFPEADDLEHRGTSNMIFGPTLYSVTSYWHGKLESRGDIDGGCTEVCASRRSPASSPSSRRARTMSRPRPVHPGNPHRRTTALASAIRPASSISTRISTSKASTSAFRTARFSGPGCASSTSGRTPGAKGYLRVGQLWFDSGLTLPSRRWNHDKKKLFADRLFDLRPFFIGGGPVPETTTKVDDSVLTWDLSAIQELNPDINVYARSPRAIARRRSRAHPVHPRRDHRRQRTPCPMRRASRRAVRPQAALQPHRLFFKTKDLQLSAVGGTNANLCSMPTR